MKRIFFLAVATAVIYFGCAKKNDQPSSTQTSKPKTLFANAGLDTTICMPYDGTGDIFKGILNGRASHDDSGKIVSYSWAEIGGFHSLIDSSNKDSTKVTFTGNYRHQFALEVRDDHGQVDRGYVVINIVQNFDAQYNGVYWDSTVGVLKTISVKIKPALIESWPGAFASNQSEFVYLSNYNGNCIDASSWKQLPYVPYDSIQLTNKSIFYSLIFDLPNNINQGYGYPEIYAKTNSGIDFNQKVSVGFIEGSIATGADTWDY
jgi:hypothetical protein